MNRFLPLLTFTLLIISGVGCQNSNTVNTNSIPPVKVIVVLDPTIKDLFDPVALELQAHPLWLNDSVRIEYDFRYIHSFEASEEISSGRIKPDGWITNPEWIALNNHNIRNLGSPQTDCRSLFGSPFVFAFSQNIMEKVEIFPDNFGWPALAKLFELPGNRLYFEHPEKSALGLSALRALWNLARAHSENDDKVVDLLRPLLNRSFGYYNSAANNLINLKQPRSGHTSVVVLTEREASKAPTNTSLLVFQPKTALTWNDFQLCRSDMDWVNAEKVGAINKLLDYLSSEKFQKSAGAAGYRPLADLSSDASREVTADQLILLQRLWQQSERPMHLIILADTSSSLRDSDLPAIKSAIEHLVARSGKNDRISLISFGNEVKVLANNSKQRAAVVLAAQNMETFGGSALYAALVEAIRLAEVGLAKNTRTRNSVLVITDGPDNNSQIDYSTLKQALDIAARTKGLDLKLVLLNEHFLNSTEVEQLHNLISDLGIESRSVVTSELVEAVEALWRSF